MSPNTHAIELSTLTPTWTNTLAVEAQTRSIHFTESPVIGTLPQAESGTLIGLVAGSQETHTALLPLLETFCGQTHYTGPISTAATTKLLVNSIFATHTAALGQSIALGRSLGIPEETLLSLLHDLPITSPSMRVIGGLIARRMFSPLFPIDLVAKDLRYTVQSAHEADVHVPTFEATLNTYEEAQHNGLGNQNITAVAALFLDHTRSELHNT